MRTRRRVINGRDVALSTAPPHPPPLRSTWGLNKTTHSGSPIERGSTVERGLTVERSVSGPSSSTEASSMHSVNHPRFRQGPWKERPAGGWTHSVYCAVLSERTGTQIRDPPRSGMRCLSTGHGVANGMRSTMSACLYLIWCSTRRMVRLASAAVAEAVVV
eukprot:3110986-Rhodomonas_salina.2